MVVLQLLYQRLAICQRLGAVIGILLADLEQFHLGRYGGHFPQDLVLGVAQLDGQRGLPVRHPHAGQLPPLGQVKGEYGVVLGLSTDVDDGPRPVHQFRTPQPAVCHIADGLAIRDLLGLGLTLVVGKDDDAPRVLEDGLDAVAQKVGGHLLLG